MDSCSAVGWDWQHVQIQWCKGIMTIMDVDLGRQETQRELPFDTMSPWEAKRGRFKILRYSRGGEWDPTPWGKLASHGTLLKTRNWCYQSMDIRFKAAPALAKKDVPDISGHLIYVAPYVVASNAQLRHAQSFCTDWPTSHLVKDLPWLTKSYQLHAETIFEVSFFVSVLYDL